jgi:hypothetical protein
MSSQTGDWCACRYVETTHAPTHIQYKLKLHSVLKIVRPAEDKFKADFEALGNHKVSRAEPSSIS